MSDNGILPKNEQSTKTKSNIINYARRIKIKL